MAGIARTSAEETEISNVADMHLPRRILTPPFVRASELRRIRKALTAMRKINKKKTAKKSKAAKRSPKHYAHK
jgi:hypothetical protein